MSCVFCEYVMKQQFLLENDLAFAIYDNYPVNQGHVLIIPKRHYASCFESTQQELLALNALIGQAKELLRNADT